jgi:hypothetical protein
LKIKAILDRCRSLTPYFGWAGSADLQFSYLHFYFSQRNLQNIVKSRKKQWCFIILSFENFNSTISLHSKYFLDGLQRPITKFSNSRSKTSYNWMWKFSRILHKMIFGLFYDFDQRALVWILREVLIVWILRIKEGTSIVKKYLLYWYFACPPRFRLCKNKNYSRQK